MKFIEKIVMALVCSLAISFGIGEARTIVNQQRGYSFNIPDYFVERDNLGAYDFRADGGDDFGAETYVRGGEGIKFDIYIQACDIEEADRAWVAQRIVEIENNYRKFAAGAKYEVYPLAINPGHLGTVGAIFQNNGTMIFSMEIIAHGKKITACVAGRAYNDETGMKILNTAYDIFESFVCFKH